MRNSGLTQGKPVAGLTIYKCLLHWKLFEAEKTSVFDRIIQIIGSAIEVCTVLFFLAPLFFGLNIRDYLTIPTKQMVQNQESNEHLAYWLSNASALLFLLQKSLKAAGSAGSTPRRKPPPPTSLFGRISQVCDHIFWRGIGMCIPAKFSIMHWSLQNLHHYILHYSFHITEISLFDWCQLSIFKLGCIWKGITGIQI